MNKYFSSGVIYKDKIAELVLMENGVFSKLVKSHEATILSAPPVKSNFLLFQ
jgi:hypothetical protein